MKLDNFEFVNFRPIWKKIKYKMTEKHLELFYEVVDVDGTLGRRIYPGCGREDNPRFYEHWFAAGRCHWNVILPCFVLNDDEFAGDFKIITNDDHSAIVDTRNMKIMCPTLNDEKIARDFFEKGFDIQTLLDFIPTVLQKPKEFREFVVKYYE